MGRIDESKAALGRPLGSGGGPALRTCPRAGNPEPMFIRQNNRFGCNHLCEQNNLNGRFHQSRNRNGDPR